MTLIKTNKVFMNKNFTTQDEVMNFLADQSIVLSISEDRDAVYEKLMEREEESTTGMMDGFAI
ncbi:TPA: PTS transporter subunit EIIA, partial [Enterococcus faecium]|nr:PTS transporter subunit EIIA [Enterococcus faecium]